MVRSGAALLIVLCVQLLWPAQFLAHLAHFGGHDLAFKALADGIPFGVASAQSGGVRSICAYDAPFRRAERPGATSRTIYRERHRPNRSAQRLLHVFYANAPKELVPDTNEEAGPLITFGHGMLDDGDVELRTKFAVTVGAARCVASAARFRSARWWRRSEQTLTRRRHHSSLLGRDAWFSLEPSFDRRFEGEVAWCRRRGGAALHNWERWVIRQCYRFRPDKYGRDKPPTPSNFIEELADRVIAQIERNAITGFKGAFDELFDSISFCSKLTIRKRSRDNLLALPESGISGRHRTGMDTPVPARVRECRG